MTVQRYRIYELSARAVMSYATEENGFYKYDLDAAAVDHCLVSSAAHEQDSNALFFQILSELHGGRYRETVTEDVSEALSEIIFYMNFQKVFDTRGLRQREVIRQKKAECMFRPEGITLDFGHGPHCYLAFERSGSMSRESRLSFIRKDFYEPVRRRIMLDLELKSCQLSKLYAYNGLMLSSGKRIEGIGIEKKHRIVVVKNPQLKTDREFMVTVQDDGTGNSTRKFYRREILQELEVTCFDGEGMISKAFAEKLDIAYCGQHIHSSFQIRLPYVKGMLHEVDFHTFFKAFHTQVIKDIWGKNHPVEDVDIILTASQFKALGWFRDSNRDWNDYWQSFKKYNHALYVTNVSKEAPEELTQLNYQFLATVSIQPEEFRPADLPGGWDHSPAEDRRNWLTKATEQLYYNLRADEHSRRAFFLDALARPDISRRSREYIMASVLKKNPLFLNEPVYTRQLDAKAEQVLKDYAVGRLLVAGDIRYLSGDLLALLYDIADYNHALSWWDVPFRTQVLSDQFASNSFYAPGAVYSKEEHCTLLRNPHIARNEEIQLSVYPEDELRDTFFGHLTDVVMVDAGMLAAERLGGADYDGDLVRTIADPILNACVRRNYTYNKYDPEINLTNNANLPFLMIPSLASPKQNPNDWVARFTTVKNTFSARIGQICNAALDRSVIAYNEKTDPKLRKKFKEETEVLAILSGLEIDAAKTGIRPDLSDYLDRKIQRTPFLKYKTMVEQAGERREWYEDTHRQKLDRFFAGTDWERVDSPVERLPLLARRLQKETRKPQTKRAADSELFTFAREQNWKAKLNSRTLELVDALLTDYEACLKRIRSCRSPAKENKRKADIERVLYRRGQEESYDTDELYALFQTLDPEHLSRLRSAIREENWHLMRDKEREAFLVRWLPGADFAAWYDLLADFRSYGFRVLADVVGDVDDANSGADRKQLHRIGDSAEFASMMQAYIEHPRAKYYRDAVAKECRELLKDIVRLSQAVPYIVALGRRDLLWELVPEQIERNVLEAKKDA
ncbi:MAG: hypothetical protein ACI4O0_00830 [Candidatus Limivicinus sp.]